MWVSVIKSDSRVQDARVVTRFETPRGPGGSRAKYGKTGKDGRAVLEGLVEGARYRLEVWPADDDLAPARLDGWVPGLVEIRLPPGHSISGRVVVGEVAVDEEDEEIEVRVFFRCGDASWQSCGLEEDGSFYIGSLPEGPVRLVALDDLETPKDDSPGAVVVPAGSRNVILRRVR